MLFKPFKVGDLLTTTGHTGKVTEIQIFSTILRTSSGKKIIIPNGKMTEGPIENIVEEGEVQVELSLLLSSATPLNTLREIVAAVVSRCTTALPNRAPEVKIKGISRDDMKVEISVWTKGEHYEETSFFLYEAIRSAFTEAGIELAKERRRETI